MLHINCECSLFCVQNKRDSGAATISPERRREQERERERKLYGNIRPAGGRPVHGKIRLNTRKHLARRHTLDLRAGGQPTGRAA